MGDSNKGNPGIWDEALFGEEALLPEGAVFFVMPVLASDDVESAFLSQPVSLTSDGIGFANSFLSIDGAGLGDSLTTAGLGEKDLLMKVPSIPDEEGKEGDEEDFDKEDFLSFNDIILFAGSPLIESPSIADEGDEEVVEEGKEGDEERDGEGEEEGKEGDEEDFDKEDFLSFNDIILFAGSPLIELPSIIDVISLWT